MMNEEFLLQDNPVFLIVLISLIAFLVVVANLISVLIFCKIFSKAGYHWAFGLLTLVPVINMCMPFFLAFADWPARKTSAGCCPTICRSRSRPAI